MQPIRGANLTTTKRKQQTAARIIGTASRVPFLLSYTAAGAGNPSDFAHALETLKNADDDAATEQMVSAEQTLPPAGSVSAGHSSGSIAGMRCAAAPR